MKTIRFLALLAAVFTVAACEKDKEETRHERDIVYTVAEETTTVHLTTEAEWDALLDQFCNYAEDGSSVTNYLDTSYVFYIGNPSEDDPAKTVCSPASSDVAYLITTEKADALMGR